MPGEIFLEGENVNLRTVEEEDLEFLTKNINDPEVRTHLTSRRPKNLEQERRFFEEVISSDEDVNLAVSVEDQVIGLISLEEKGDLEVAEIGIWIDPEHHREGYGSEAAQLIVEYGFSELNYHKIIARAHEENKGSNKIWEKLGFTKEGTLREQIYRKGEFQDANIYGVLKKEWR